MKKDKKCDTCPIVSMLDALIKQGYAKRNKIHHARYIPMCGDKRLFFALRHRCLN